MTRLDHSDPSGLYSYKAQPSRVLWDLNKLVHAVSPLIGYESLEGYPTPGFADEATKDDVEEWSEKGLEVMQGFEEEYFKVERQAEQEGWIKVSPLPPLLPFATPLGLPQSWSFTKATSLTIL